MVNRKDIIIYIRTGDNKPVRHPQMTPQVLVGNPHRPEACCEIRYLVDCASRFDRPKRADPDERAAEMAEDGAERRALTECKDRRSGSTARTTRWPVEIGNAGG
jgi:hypothetical protein